MQEIMDNTVLEFECIYRTRAGYIAGICDKESITECKDPRCYIGRFITPD